jgi:carbohydrate-selective porin OprB
MLSGEAGNTKFIVFGLTRHGLNTNTPANIGDQNGTSQIFGSSTTNVKKMTFHLVKSW